MDPNGSQWIPMNPNGFQWIPMDPKVIRAPKAIRAPKVYQGTQGYQDPKRLSGHPRLLGHWRLLGHSMLSGQTRLSWHPRVSVIIDLPSLSDDVLGKNSLCSHGISEPCLCTWSTRYPAPEPFNDFTKSCCVSSLTSCCLGPSVQQSPALGTIEDDISTPGNNSPAPATYWPCQYTSLKLLQYFLLQLIRVFKKNTLKCDNPPSWPLLPSTVTALHVFCCCNFSHQGR